MNQQESESGKRKGCLMIEKIEVKIIFQLQGS